MRVELYTSRENGTSLAGKDWFRIDSEATKRVDRNTQQPGNQMILRYEATTLE